jgi:hypothetical protein
MVGCVDRQWIKAADAPLNVWRTMDLDLQGCQPQIVGPMVTGAQSPDLASAVSTWMHTALIGATTYLFCSMSGPSGRNSGALFNSQLGAAFAAWFEQPGRVRATVAK